MKFNPWFLLLVFVMACTTSGNDVKTDEALVYTKSMNGNLDLYKSDVLGQWEERITTNPGMDWGADWIPAQNQLTYFMHDNLGRFSWVKKSLGSQKADTLPFGDLMNVRLSPDGAYLYYAHENEKGTQIKRRRYDGTEDEFLTNEEGNRSRFGFDRQHQQMAFISDQTDHNQLFVMELASRKVKQITDLPVVAKYHSFSPEGDKIAVCLAEPGANPNWDIFIYDLTAETLERLTNTPYSEKEIAWSLSGKKIAFHGTSSADGDQIYTIDLEDGKFTKITSGNFYHAEPEWIEVR